MKPILALLYPSSLFLLSVTLLVAGESTTIYTPTDDITLNCGSSGRMVSNFDFRTWSGDINSELSPIEVGGSTSRGLKAPPSSSTGSQVPYTTARLSHSEFKYRFPVRPGQKFIRLYFYPGSYSANFDRSKSLFSVKTGGYTLLKDFNVSISADADYLETMLKEFCIYIEPEQQMLNITFTPSKDGYAFINGIEIMSMPAYLYHTAAQDDGPSIIGNENRNVPVKNHTAMEMIYRINVGGSPVSPNEDTGMYRTWDSTDEIYLNNPSRTLSMLSQSNNTHLKFAKIPNYTAPVDVYRTGRSMEVNRTISKSYNLTWGFPVDPQFYYLVRLHFCEIIFRLERDRVFQIFIADLPAEQRADIIQWSGGNGIPVYRDYLVFVPSLPNKKKVDISVALQANQDDSKTRYNNAILNGLEIFKLNDTSGNLAGPNPDQPPAADKMKPESQRKPKKKSIPMLAIIAGVVSVLLVPSLFGFLVFRRTRKLKDSGSSHRMTKSITNIGSHIPSYLCRYFSLAEIIAATKNFDDTLIVGIGGFGHVYKGHFDDGATLVAIKRLKATSSQGAHEFMTEIKMLSQLRHRHLVSLIGYCADQGEMVLVYDYMSRGTLSDHLHHIEKPHLPWERRLQICIGAAQGLHYLHTGSKGTIIHRDVKSTNILLDEKWVAKVSDFGLSKMGNITMSKTHISTKVKGSFGYVDPDYYRRQQLTEKSDVYSFGVVLCEVLCGRPAVTIVDNNRVGLAGWAKKCHRNGKFDQIVDPNLKGEIAVRCLHKFASIAMSCLDDNGINRPSMDDVVRGLQFALQMQENNEDYIDHIERTVQHEISLIKDNEGSCSSVQSSAANESIQELTGTIFSEIIDPVGR
ncbi:receptor-like protein kinase FERONIA [Rosa chinensis]|uniref:receptor-like protein kinase FERONIA n=1 Tax=Rosa chinensis TaxID=74649 RepID=UPI001AD8EAE4|nr:receptor-like protein kinase FERONIA [Rosa chinensis]